MLFDLRSRGRRRTVQAVYLTLALLMGGGLVLFGVGAGNGFGGLLDAFKGGSGSGVSSAASQQEQQALTATRKRPNDPAAWLSLMQARYAAAQQQINPNVLDPQTGQPVIGDGAKQKLVATGQAWTRYASLTSSPDPDQARIAAQAFDATKNYAAEAQVWGIVAASDPSQYVYLQYEAVSAYKAKNTRLGDLATARAVALAPKDQKATVKSQIQAQAGTGAPGAAGAVGAAGASGVATATSAAPTPAPAPVKHPATPAKH